MNSELIDGEEAVLVSTPFILLQTMNCVNHRRASASLPLATVEALCSASNGSRTVVNGEKMSGEGAGLVWQHNN